MDRYHLDPAFYAAEILAILVTVARLRGIFQCSCAFPPPLLGVAADQTVVALPTLFVAPLNHILV